ncbi:uroporphyrinogen-III C-methyltransferase [Tropicimonas sp.]|uniref:uroporphyrinogen-III C-methyltransferase n=1 Tax=Tropicimonas sp. TaxID=2067044 RepID=UPI003A8735CA
MTDDDPISLPAHDWPEFPPGLVWLVGAGPGEPGLLTLQGLHALRAADVIVHDALVDGRILEWRRADTQLEYAGKRGGKPSARQRDISHRLIELSRDGQRVLRLKGGDPFVFGRGGEEAQTLVQAGVPIRVTPGISAGIGGLAYAGIPVTHRDVNQAVTFLTGHDQTGLTPAALDWPALARGSQVLVMYMAMKHLPKIADALLAAGRRPDEPLAIVSNATLPGMRVLETTLGTASHDAEAQSMEAPAIVCLGRVVLMRQAIDWMSQLQGNPPRNPDPLGGGARTTG